MSDSHGSEQAHHDTSQEEATVGKSPRRTLIVTLVMLLFVSFTFIPPLLTRTNGSFFIAIWETLVIVAVFGSMIMVKKLLEAERSRDGDMKQAPMPTAEA